MSSAPEADRPVLLHELPTAGIEVHHTAPPPGALRRPAAPDGARAAAAPGEAGTPARTAHGRLREEWWRACLVGTAAALLAVGVTAGAFRALGWSPMTMMGMSQPAQAAVVSPAPRQAGGLTLDSASNLAAAESLPAALSDAEQFFAADAPGAAAVYQQPGTMDPRTGGPRLLTYVGVPVGGSIADPASRLDAYLRSVAAGHPDATFQPADAGPGATGECASFRGDFGQQTECGWTAPGTVGIFTAPARNYDPTQLATLIRQARPALMHPKPAQANRTR